MSTIQKQSAPRGIYYHGTSIRNLQAILSQGLLPQVKIRRWDEDQDASGSLSRPSLQSYGGIYVTQKVQTAGTAPSDDVQQGRWCLAILELQPNSLFLDEDEALPWLKAPLGRLSDHPMAIGQAWVIAAQPVPEDIRGSGERQREQYVESCLKQLDNLFEAAGRQMHPALRERITPLLGTAWKASLARLAAYMFSGKAGADSIRKCYTRVLGDSAYDSMRPESEWLPTPEQAEKDYRAAMEPITRTLRTLARTDNEGKTQRSFSNARVTEPIGYSGSNRILAVLEIRVGLKYRGGTYKQPLPIIVHYGSVPEDFITQCEYAISKNWQLFDAAGKLLRQGDLVLPEMQFDMNGNAVNTEGEKIAAVLDASAQGASGTSSSPIPSWEQWVGDCLSTGAGLDGLKSELSEDVYGETFAGDEGTTRLHRKFDRVVRKLKSFSYPLSIFRAIKAVTPDSIRTRGAGTSWTTNLRSAKPYLGQYSNGKLFTMEGKVSVEGIDFARTIYHRLGPFGQDEQEITLKPEAVIELVALKEEKRPWQLPPESLLRLTAGHTAKTAREQELQAKDPANEDGYWAGAHNAASGILAVARDTRRICLAWRNKKCHQGDCWGLIGGAVKDSLTPGESARAEMAEEVGYEGTCEMHPGYVFADGEFRFHNFVGLVESEFALDGEKKHAWETDEIEWVTLAEAKSDMEDNPEDYHPGVITFFEESGDLIQELVAGNRTSGSLDPENAIIQASKSASPDFGYSQYNNREDDLKRIRFKVEWSSEDLGVGAHFDGRCISVLSAVPREDGITIEVSGVDIPTEWRGTGLGQMLYDAAIRAAKRKGYRYFRSDSDLSEAAVRAWQRISQRYPTVSEADRAVLTDGENEGHATAGYCIDLSKVPVSQRRIASPDFGYSQYNNRERSLKRLHFRVHGSPHWFSAEATTKPGFDTVDVVGFVACTFIAEGEFAVTDAHIEPEWKGTGLGQTLYDAVIRRARNLGARFLLSDDQRSSDADAAWKRLGARYPVEFDPHENRYRLSLSEARKSAHRPDERAEYPEGSNGWVTYPEKQQ